MYDRGSRRSFLAVSQWRISLSVKLQRSDTPHYSDNNQKLPDLYIQYSRWGRWQGITTSISQLLDSFRSSTFKLMGIELKAFLLINRTKYRFSFRRSGSWCGHIGARIWSNAQNDVIRSDPLFPGFVQFSVVSNRTSHMEIFLILMVISN